MNTSVVIPEPGTLEAECPGGVSWAFYILGECIRSPRDKVSIAFGILAICAWLLFALPQIIENYKKKIPDAAVSEFLLIFWILGDSLNFIGALMANQLFFQKALAVYTVVVDFILTGQFYYYRWIHRRNLKREIQIAESNGEPEPVGGKVLAGVMLGCVALCAVPFALPVSQTSGMTVAGASSYASRRLFESTAENPFANFLKTTEEKVGYAFGWISTIMYALGRMHQIYVNWRRKSTDGLSFYLFFLAVLGNTFYSCQIFIKSTSLLHLVNSMPWILGSIGILVFDAFILIQFFIYRGRIAVNDPENMCQDSDVETPSNEK
ncbi:unnamed protein product [Rodentolepis nana]|uniref:Lysosomal amino acid transporter 1 homolog n=1 Tax=Rodentolepis nana TaxID=102285 RepID=A0A0R3T3B0_RODNA|nr:unnamed protein product [Rodentolepis nana]